MNSTAQTKRPAGEGPFNVRPRNRSWNVTTTRRSSSRMRREAAAASSEARGKKVTTPPLMHVMKYTVPSVLVFAALGNQGKHRALLLENPASMWCFVAATCVYWLIAGEMKRTPPTPTRFRIYRGTAVASAMLSGASLVSMLLPRPVPVWIPLPAAIILYAAFCFFYRAICKLGLSAGVILNAAFNLIYSGIKFVANRMHAHVESPLTLPV